MNEMISYFTLPRNYDGIYNKSMGTIPKYQWNNNPNPVLECTVNAQ